MLYADDLAQIHVEGYGFHWEQAASALLAWMAELGVPGDGVVVDLGCGGGQWLRALQEQGYQACGVDVSPSMARIARQNAPGASVLCGSFDEAPMHACDAVTSLGEPINYLGSRAAIREAFRNVYAALAPGGVFIFDARHPPDRPVPPRDHFKQSASWFCHARIEEDHRKGTITRRITTFVLQSEGSYRRGEETHRLKVVSRAEMLQWLRKLGFRVRVKRGYGDYELGPRQSVFVCRK